MIGREIVDIEICEAGCSIPSWLTPYSVYDIFDYFLAPNNQEEMISFGDITGSREIIIRYSDDTIDFYWGKEEIPIEVMNSITLFNGGI